MQPLLKNDMLYLLRIIEAAGKIILYTQDFNDEKEFFEQNEQMTFNACLNLLAQIGEQAGKLSPLIQQKHPQPDWGKVRGMRNRIVHDYSGVDRLVVFDSIKNYLPGLKIQLTNITRIELDEGNFDREELELAKTSPYLRHVDFSLFV